MIQGNNIFISVDGTTPFAATRSNEIETECETIEISSPYVGEWRSRITGRKSWQLQGNVLVAAASDMYAVLSVGATYTLYICARNSTPVLYGQAILTRAKIDAAVSSIAKGSFQFVGVGALEAFVPVTSISISAPQINLQPNQSATNPVSATISPTNATNKSLAWSSDDTSIATVTQNGDDYTITTTSKGGSCKLYARATDGSGVSSYCNVVVGLE